MGSQDQIPPAVSAIMFLTAMFQLFYVAISFVAEMRRWQVLHYFNPATKRAYANWTNFILLICVWVEFITKCKFQSCFGDSTFAKATDEEIFFRVMEKVVQVLNFAVEVPSVYLLVKAILKTLPLLVNHFGLFFAVYYVFAGMGVSFFCGKITQSVESGGPGYWGQMGHYGTNMTRYTNQSLAASGVRYSQTEYGQSPYYYNLNYDSWHEAVTSFYVIMI